MSVYNAEEYLSTSIMSILNQSFADFEFIIIDDGSTDNSKNIIKYSATKDSRIKPFFFKENKGLTHRLNLGISLSQGRYIARMDADDISLPQRLNRQLEAFAESKQIAVVGVYPILIDSDGKCSGKKKLPCNSEDIRKAFIFYNPIVHSSVLMRKDFLLEVGAYNEKYIHSQDKELWIKLLKEYEIINIPEYLHYSRKTNGSITYNKRISQKRFAYKATKEGFYSGVFTRYKFVYFIFSSWWMLFPDKVLMGLLKLKNRKK